MKINLLKKLTYYSFSFLILCSFITNAADPQADLVKDSAPLSAAHHLKGEQYMDSRVIEECTRLSFAGEITFPEVVQRLAAIGVTFYRVDLLGLEKTAYGAISDFHKEAFRLPEGFTTAATFDAEGVKTAILDIQQQKIKYMDFLQRIMAAGISHYEVFIKGRKAIYTSPDGDFHVELFPGSST